MPVRPRGGRAFFYLLGYHDRVEQILIVPQDPFSAEATLLIEELYEELARRYGDPGNGPFRPEDVTGSRSLFLIARVEGRVLGCGGLREDGPDTAEVKRMYVRPEARGEGLGRRLLLELERHAVLLGYKRIRLETGIPQPEALRLYESSGYRRIPGYGEYKDDPRTVSFEKDL